LGEDLRKRELAATVDAIGEVDGRPEVARPERVATAPVVRPAVLDLGCSVHREGARSFEPPLVSGRLVQREKRAAVSRGAVAEVGALAQGAGKPRQLAGRNGELLLDEVGERRDDARRAVAPLRADPAVSVVLEPLPGEGRPVDETVLLDSEARERL